MFQEPLKESDMDVVGNLFGMRFIKRDGLRDLVELYIEDDENYHLKASFDRTWLNDLQYVTEKAKSL